MGTFRKHICSFDKLNSVEKTAYVLGSELQEYEFDDFPSLVKEFVVRVWDARKQKLYSDDSCCSQLQSLAEDLQLAGVERQMDGKLRSSGKVQMVRICLYVYVCVPPPMIVGACGSGAMAAL